VLAVEEFAIQGICQIWLTELLCGTAKRACASRFSFNEVMELRDSVLSALVLSGPVM